MYVMNTELISGKRVDISTEIPVGETKNTELSIRNTVNDLISPRIEDYPGTWTCSIDTGRQNVSSLHPQWNYLRANNTNSVSNIDSGTLDISK